MRKLLLLTGIFTILSYNAHAHYYKHDDEYQPHKQHQVLYNKELKQFPQYYRISKEKEKNYNERKYIADNSNTIRPYIGYDYTTTFINYKKITPISIQINNTFYGSKLLSRNFQTFTPIVGIKFNKYFGIEGFCNNFDKKTNYLIENSLSSLGLDLQGYLPFETNTEILLSLGIVEYEHKLKDNQLIHTELNEYAIDKKTFYGTRLGVGIQYNINNHIALKTMAKYIITNSKYIQDITELSAGIRLIF